MDVTETMQSGYSLESATCTIGDVSVGIFDDEDSIDNIVIGLDDIVSCEFINLLAAYCGDGQRLWVT